MSYQNAPVVKQTTSASSIRSESSGKLEYTVEDVDMDVDQGSDVLYWEQARTVTWFELFVALLFPLPFGVLRGDKGLWNKSALLTFWRLISDQMSQPDRLRPALAIWSTSVGVVFMLSFFVFRIGFFLIVGVYFLLNATLLLCSGCYRSSGRNKTERERFLYEGM